MIFKNITMLFGNVIFFTCPTNNMRWVLTEDLICSESFVCPRDKRIIETSPVLCQTKYNSLDLAEFVMHELKVARCQVQCRDQDVYEVNELSFLEAHLSYLYIHAI